MINKKTLILTFLFLALFLSLGAQQAKVFLRPDEFFYFKSAQNIVESNNWLTPYYFKNLRFQKPILFYWLVGISFKLFGINWFAARLPSILAGLGIIWLTFLLGNIFYNRKTAFIAIFVLTTIPFVFRFFRLALPEATLTLFITLAFYCFVKFIHNGFHSKGWLLFGICLGMSALTKGPIGIIILLFSLIIFRLWNKEVSFFLNKYFWLSISLGLVIGASWYVYAYLKHGSSFWNFIIATEVSDRMRLFSRWSLTGKILEYLKNFPVYVFANFVDLLPWSVFLPFAIAKAFKTKEKKGDLSKILLSWLLTVFVIFSFALSRHTHYILPLSVPFALIIASFALHNNKLYRISLAIIIAVYIGLFGYLLYFPSDFTKRGGYDYYADIILEDLKPEERIAIGSHEFIPQNLEAYLNHPVEKHCGDWLDIDEKTHYDWNRQEIYGFLNSNQRVYLLIKKEDLFAFTDQDLRDNLNILAKGYIIKRHPKINLQLLFKNGLKSVLYNEVWLVSNR